MLKGLERLLAANLKAVAARSAEDHLVAKASGRAIDHAGDAEAVDRDEPVDAAVTAP